MSFQEKLDQSKDKALIVANNLLWLSGACEKIAINCYQALPAVRKYSVGIE